MPDLKTIIDTVELPIELPSDAFIQYQNKPRLVDFWIMIDALPLEIKQAVDRDLTISTISPEKFAIPLKSSQYITIRLKDKQIVSLKLKEAE